MTTQNETIWEELDNPGIESIATLYSWSLNYNFDKSPFLIFCDLIGWTQDKMGQSFIENPELDMVGADYLAAALKDYAHKPNDVKDYIVRLFELDGQG